MATHIIAANNGPDPVAVANSMRQYVKNSLITAPLQYLKQKTIWYFCGSSRGWATFALFAKGEKGVQASQSLTVEQC